MRRALLSDQWKAGGKHRVQPLCLGRIFPSHSLCPRKAAEPNVGSMSQDPCSSRRFEAIVPCLSSQVLPPSLFEFVPTSLSSSEQAGRRVYRCGRNRNGSQVEEHHQRKPYFSRLSMVEASDDLTKTAFNSFRF